MKEAEYMIDIIFKEDDFMDTICALSTPRGKGGIAVIRVSGDNAFEITQKAVKTKKKISEMKGYTITYGEAVSKGKKVDECLVSVFKKPSSFTGEDVCEISCHGSQISCEIIINSLIENGARIARKGEFTKRAFLNGKLTLSRAEAVSDIIESKTERALFAAVNRLDGGISDKIIKMRERLLDLLATIQVSTDFPEEDTDSFAGGNLKKKLEKIKTELEDMKKSARIGEFLNRGIVCAICGIPNTGKSSLLNAVLNKERAIVTDIAGTTRDIIEEYTDIDGLPVKFGDTAGIRESGDIVEKKGVEKSCEYIKSADMCIFVKTAGKELNEEEIKILEIIGNKTCVKVANKCDLYQNKDSEYISTSAKTGEGINKVMNAVSEAAGSCPQGALIANERQYEAVVRALESINKAYETVCGGFYSDLAAIDIEAAIGFLGEAEGISVNQETVDRIFEKFCLGK